MTNPDVYFNEDVPAKLYEYMEAHTEIGLIMPRVCFPDGSDQRLCKLLPRPCDLMVRRFVRSGRLVDHVNRRFELRDIACEGVVDVPYLSGCFMFMRSAALEAGGLFDERYFMYFEDTDLSRRIHREYRTVFYPHATIYHRYDGLSKRDRRMLMIHIRSAIRYFNKWGWLFDRERRRINMKTIERIRELLKSLGASTTYHLVFDWKSAAELSQTIDKNDVIIMDTVSKKEGPFLLSVTSMANLKKCTCPCGKENIVPGDAQKGDIFQCDCGQRIRLRDYVWNIIVEGEEP